MTFSSDVERIRHSGYEVLKLAQQGSNPYHSSTDQPANRNELIGEITNYTELAEDKPD